MTQVMPPVQQSQTFDLPSGAKLVVTIAPFASAWALMRASLKTLRGASIKAEDLKTDMAALIANPSAFSFILDRLVDFATSPEVEASIWNCATRALYIPVGSSPDFPGVKVTASMFDDPAYGTTAREDYAKIVVALMEVNCRPFLAKALSSLQNQKTPTGEGQP